MALLVAGAAAGERAPALLLQLQLPLSPLASSTISIMVHQQQPTIMLLPILLLCINTTSMTSISTVSSSNIAGARMTATVGQTWGRQQQRRMQRNGRLMHSHCCATLTLLPSWPLLLRVLRLSLHPILPPPTK